MTLAARQTYHLQYVRWHTQQERKAVRLVLARFTVVFTRITTTLERTNVRAVLDTLELLVSEVDTQRLLEQIYSLVGVLAAERQYNQLVPVVKAKLPQLLTKDRDAPLLPERPKPSGLIRIDHNSETWRQRMVALARSSETASRIAQVTAKTRDLVRTVLTEAASQVWSLPRTIRELRGVLLDRKRATLIARTETTRAANAGHEIGAQTTLLTLNKVWIATADARTRDAHLAMLHAKPVPREGFFSVGGIPMKYPGDPAGGAANVCNCRCVVSYVPANNVFD